MCAPCGSSAGGNPVKYRRVQKLGVRAAAAAALAACVREAIDELDIDGRPSPAAIKDAYEACKDDGKDALEEAGGSRDDFEKERRAGARSEGSEELQRCVEAELDEKETPTNADKATALQTCEDEAKDAPVTMLQRTFVD